jgi:hypothetical protein
MTLRVKRVVSFREALLLFVQFRTSVRLRLRFALSRQDAHNAELGQPRGIAGWQSNNLSGAVTPKVAETATAVPEVIVIDDFAGDVKRHRASPQPVVHSFMSLS